ncbi:DUF5320 domain-containing protein [Fusibacter ferrireducens]|uniref:DUF5320 domain-containing protein n=1 Tax=Fusibacter ferrireducens TaxID=2785058 RepID=A0ABR9ZSH1_9FIRM|nr:DUF5320 domain-containing protein [Fusibacter ferrireducens]MBF4693415.1 DUF5320 domain-containing protein [Fusibacter ferrireducens]
MPRRDGTGPMGEGTLTGRGLGHCDNGEDRAFNTENQSFDKPAKGIGRGRNCMGGRNGGLNQGRGRGCGRKGNRRFGRNMSNQ